MTDCKLAEEMASGSPGMHFGEEGMGANEDGPLMWGCQWTEPRKEEP